MDKMAIARRKCARGAVLTLLFAYPLRKKGLIQENDLKLDL